MGNMKKYSVAIVEDEDVHAKTLEQFLSDFAAEEGIDLAFTRYGSAIDAAEDYKGQFQVVFLDIMMPGMNGMELAREIRQSDPRVCLIFVTSLAQFALEGYEVEATDYLLKPLSYPEFKLKMHRAFSKVSSSDAPVLRFQSYGGFLIVPIEEIQYCETSGHSVIYHATSGDYRKHQPMKEAEKALQGMGFLRINSCYLVARKEIVGVENRFVVLRNGERLLISRPRLSAVAQELSSLGGEDKA